MGKQQPHTGRRRTQRTQKEMPRAKCAKRLRVVGGKEERSEEPKARSAASEAQRAKRDDAWSKRGHSHQPVCMHLAACETHATCRRELTADRQSLRCGGE